MIESKKSTRKEQPPGATVHIAVKDMATCGDMLGRRAEADEDPTQWRSGLEEEKRRGHLHDRI